MILFVDDEPSVIKNYVQELQLEEFKFDVVFRSHVDDALHVFDERYDEIELVVLDVMMPYGKSFSSAETERGLRTGFRLYERMRQSHPQLPIVFFTNVSQRQTLPENMLADSYLACYYKQDFQPSEFAEQVKRFLDRFQENQSRLHAGDEHGHND